MGASMRTATGTLGRSLAVARFAVGSNLGRWLTRGGLLAGAGVMVLGPLLSARQGLGWHFDREIGFLGFFTMALFTVRSGLEEQRELELVTFVRHNLASPIEHGLGLVIGLGGTWLGLCALTFGTVLIATVGDVSMAAWATAAWGLRLLVILGFVLLVEAIASLRLPLILPSFGYLGLLVALSVILPEEHALALFIPVERGDSAALARLAIQGVASFAATAGLFLALTVFARPLGHRLRQIVPLRH